MRTLERIGIIMAYNKEEAEMYGFPQKDSLCNICGRKFDQYDNLLKLYCKECTDYREREQKVVDNE